MEAISQPQSVRGKDFYLGAESADTQETQPEDDSNRESGKCQMVPENSEFGARTGSNVLVGHFRGDFDR